jgi:hypothetical protein
MSSGMPETLRDLQNAKYKFNGSADCRICASQIEWWTTTHGKKMPFDPMPETNSKAIAHWATCAEKVKAVLREDLRKRAHDVHPQPGQTKGNAILNWLFDQLAEALAELKVAQRRSR